LYLHSGYSIHDTSDKICLLSSEKRNGRYVTFGNNGKAQIKDKVMIGKHNSAKI